MGFTKCCILTLQIIEESRYHPVVFPLKVTVFVHTGDYFGGVLGTIKAADEDPYDTLTYSIVPDDLGRSRRYFSINSHNGTLAAQNGIDEGSYVVNISVSDGKFTTFSQAEAEVIDINSEMINNSVIIQLEGASPEEFLLSYKRRFHRGIKNLLNVKSRDVVILSLQPSHKRFKRSSKKLIYGKPSYHPADLDILFAVRKNQDVYFNRTSIRKRIELGRSNLEAELGLQVVGVVKDKCTGSSCENGYCEELVVIDNDQVVIATDTLSYVSLHHHHEAKCRCQTGFSGARCDIAVNQCAHKPCQSFQKCVPDTTRVGYMCVCPEGLVGVTCEQNVSSCINKEHSPECYHPKSPMTFKGKSYAQYSLRNPIERHFTFSLWFRTLNPYGNIMFTAGRIDYSILEVRFPFLKF